MVVVVVTVVDRVSFVFFIHYHHCMCRFVVEYSSSIFAFHCLCVCVCVCQLKMNFLSKLFVVDTSLYINKTKTKLTYASILNIIAESCKRRKVNQAQIRPFKTMIVQ